MNLKLIQFVVVFLNFCITGDTESDAFTCGKNDNPRRLAVSSTVGLWPWVGSLGFYSSKSWRHQCGSTLISSTVLTTAAHCAKEVEKATINWKIRLGDFDLSDPDDDLVVVEREIKDVFIHPDYDDWKLYFDVAILKIDPIKFSLFVSPVCLPTEPSTDLHKYEGKSATVLGWGRKANFEDQSDTLRRAFLTMYEYSYCNSTHANSGGSIQRTVEEYLPELYQPHVLCAGYEAAEDGSCDGDSGGPLLTFSTRALQYTLVGTVAGGVASNCGDKDFPGVYIRMDHPKILNWVREQMEIHKERGDDDNNGNSQDKSGLLQQTKKIECGRVFGVVNSSTRVALDTSDISSWPWMSSIGEYQNDQWQHYCGGSLVSEKFLLTAAHCFENNKSYGWSIRFGLRNLLDTGHYTVTKQILRITKHPKYRNALAYYDIAVVEIESLDLTDHIGPVCLPARPSLNPEKYTNWATVLVGWGSQFKAGTFSEDLLKAHLTIYEGSFCNETHENTGFYLKSQVQKFIPDLIQSHMFCAGSDVSGQGSCEGDSGGPLLNYNPNKMVYTQLGVVAGGVGECGDQRFPGIYIRLDDPEILEFIQGVTSLFPSSDYVENTAAIVRTTPTPISNLGTDKCRIISFPKSDLKSRFEGTCFPNGQFRSGILVLKNGNSYQGQFQNNKFDGQGKYSYSKNDALKRHSYDGAWKNGKKNGVGIFRWKTGAFFEGEYSFDVRDGLGTMYFAPNDPLNREQYDGQWDKGQINGRGKLTFNQGDKYEGDFESGAIRGNGTYFWSDGRKYIGQMYNGKSHGKGTMYYAPDDKKFRLKYEGDWENGKWNGNGKLTLTFGDVHDGQFVNDIVQGSGTYTSVSGNKYVGQWKDGKANGYGIFYFAPNNSLFYQTYEGDWKNNKKHGFGALTWKFGDIYEGDFVEDVAEGRGTYFWADGRKYVGQFRNNSNHGQGELFFEPDEILGRVRYSGQWIANKNFQESTFNGGIMNGFGKFYWADGTHYDGQFKNDSPNGQGTIFDKDGNVLQEGQWQNGRLVQ